VSQPTAGAELEVVRTGLEGKVGTVVVWCKAVMSMCKYLSELCCIPQGQGRSSYCVALRSVCGVTGDEQPGRHRGPKWGVTGFYFLCLWTDINMSFTFRLGCGGAVLGPWCLNWRVWMYRAAPDAAGGEMLWDRQRRGGGKGECGG